MEYALYAVAAIGLGAGAFIVVRSPSFWLDFGKEVFKRLLPSLLKAVAPKDLTEDQKQINRQGGDIFRRKNQREK